METNLAVENNFISENMTYFGVYIPKPEVEGTDIEEISSEDTSSNHESLIFTDKSSALDVLRQHKEARLRHFTNREQAESYVQFGHKQGEQQQDPHQELKRISGERSPFQSPTKQELQQFRKQIEAGNLERVRQIVWENPRYLISSGDTPTCLKEGPRYNAMHICAQLDRPSIAELLLETVADPNFAQLYTDHQGSPEMCANLSQNLLDLYLNMPDKSRGETPLHFAVKHGHVGVVELLIGYPQCLSLANREGKEPKDIICQRNAQAPLETLKRLELLMGDPYYVPVLRSVTNELPPLVGPPYSPKEPPHLQLQKEESEGLSVELSITALAGPMTREKASKFYRRWKTPPRLGSNTTSPLASLPFTSPVKMTPSKSDSSPMSRRKLFSPEQENNSNLEHPTTPTPISVSEESPWTCTLNDSFRERHIKNSDVGKGLEVVGRQLARQEQLEWRESWPFLDSFVDISSGEGLALLEAYLEAKMQKARRENMALNCNQLKQILNTVLKSKEQSEVSEDDDLFLDCSSSSDDEDGYQTPSDNVPYHLFINGIEPSKCDLDVLNAIFTVDVDQEKLPYVHAWKTAMEGYTTQEMELFPLPKKEQKTHWYLPGRDQNKYQTSIHPRGLFGAL